MSSLPVALRSNGLPLWDFKITLIGYTTLGKTPRDEWSAPDANTCTCKHTTLTWDKHPCSRRDSNPESQPAGGILLTLQKFNENAGSLWRHCRLRFWKIFPAVEAALGWLNPAAGGVLWMGLKFQICKNIFNIFFNNPGNVLVPSRIGANLESWIFALMLIILYDAHSERCRYSHKTFWCQPWRRPEKGLYTVKWMTVRSADCNVLCSVSSLRVALVFTHFKCDRTKKNYIHYGIYRDTAYIRSCGTWSMHPGTLETMTSTETCKWTLWPAKSRGLHKGTKEGCTITRKLRPYSSWTTRASCADSRGKKLLN